MYTSQVSLTALRYAVAASRRDDKLELLAELDTLRISLDKLDEKLRESNSEREARLRVPLS